MILIRDIVKQVLATGYLSMEVEDQLRQLLSSKYDLEDFYAFMALQQAAMAGQIKQESRERKSLQTTRNQEAVVNVSWVLN